jgi:hypothetical protein
MLQGITLFEIHLPLYPLLPESAVAFTTLWPHVHSMYVMIFIFVWHFYQIKKSTNKIETEKCLDLARFCKVYRELRNRYSKRSEAGEQEGVSTNSVHKLFRLRKNKSVINLFRNGMCMHARRYANHFIHDPPLFGIICNIVMISHFPSRM